MRLSIEDMQAPEFLKDRYTQFELLGAGGMGVVYRAFDQTLQKDVAIKILPGQLTPERAMRFQQEARTASRLKHPNLITILDFGISPTGEPFLVMDYAAGATLDSIIKERGTIDLNSALAIVDQICEGIKHAHANSVIHRDLKPSNVIVESVERTVKVVDFGIAKFTEESKGLTITPQGRLIGTPQYMSPEQIAGAEVDARSDIYSIGCILFHLLAGRPPFESDTSIEVLRSARTKRAPSIHEVNPSISIPREVEELVAKSLLKEPSQRQSSVEVFQDELYAATDAVEQLEKERTARDGSKGSAELSINRGPSPRRKPRPMMIALLGIGTLVPIAGFVYLIMTSPAVSPTDPLASKSAPAMEINTEISVRPSQHDADIANKSKVLWKQHFKRKMQDGTERYEALDSLTPEDLKQMGDEKLKVFSINFSRTSTPITDECCKLISRIDAEQLDLCTPTVTDEGLKYIGRMTNLKKLELSNCDVSDEGVTFLQNLKKMEIIQLSKTRISDNALDVLKTFKHLKGLELFSTPVTDGGIAKLKDLPIVEIGLMGCPRVTDKVLEPLAAHGKLTHVNLSETAITDRGLLCLRPCKNLDTLRISDCKGVTDATVSFVADKIPQLHYLDVSGTFVTKKSIPTILKLKHLSDLHVCALGFTDNDVAPFKSLATVTKLDLSENPITDRTLHTLADMPSLKTICLNRCPGTTNDGASYLQSAHSLKFGGIVEVLLTASEEVERVGALLGKGGEEPDADREEGDLTTGSKSNPE